MRIRFIIPGDINIPTGGYRYDRTIIEEWRGLGIHVDIISLAGGYPFPLDKDIEMAHAILDEAQDADICVIDGLAGGGAPSLLERCANDMPVVALIHHPLTLENGLTKQQATALEKLEREGLKFSQAVITTSPATTKTVGQLFGYTADKIHTILPGVERGTPVPFRTEQPLRLLSVGSITERKGHDVLIHALGHLRDLSWSLDIVGPKQFNPKLFQKLQHIATKENIAGNIQFHGTVDAERLDALYQRADIFALASRYEGYGMAYAEAIVRGLPVVATTAGAIPDTVPETAGLLVPPDDIDALAHALRTLLCDDALRQEKRSGALKAEPDFPTWPASAKQFHALLRTLS